ncbi:transposase [Komagataeibacter sp. NFXK3]
MIRYGIAWRAMPNDLPPWSAVYQQFRCRMEAGCFDALGHLLALHITPASVGMIASRWDVLWPLCRMRRTRALNWLMSIRDIPARSLPEPIDIQDFLFVEMFNSTIVCAHQQAAISSLPCDLHERPVRLRREACSRLAPAGVG